MILLDELLKIDKTPAGGDVYYDERNDTLVVDYFTRQRVYSFRKENRIKNVPASFSKVQYINYSEYPEDTLFDF